MACCGRGNSEAYRRAVAAVEALYVSKTKPKDYCPECRTRIARAFYWSNGIKVPVFKCANGHFMPVR
jgi:hypothetical protein